MANLPLAFTRANGNAFGRLAGVGLQLSRAAERTVRSAAILLAVLWTTLASAAEPRIMAVEGAWNLGDTLGVQSNWSRKNDPDVIGAQADRKSTRLNSSHQKIS